MKTHPTQSTSRPTLLRGFVCTLVVVATSMTSRADSPPVAPEPRDLIEKSIESAGGREKLGAIKSMSIIGEMSVPMQKIAGKIQVYMKPGKAVVIADIPGVGQSKSGINGDIAYEVSDLMGVRLLGDDEKQQLLDGLDPDAQFKHFLDLKDMKVTGPEKIGDAEAWKLSGINSSGDAESHWLDTKNYRTLKSAMVKHHQMGKIPVEVSFSDYKLVEGVPFASTISSKIQMMTMVMTLNEVKINPQIDDATFELPAEVKRLAEQAKAKS